MSTRDVVDSRPRSNKKLLIFNGGSGKSEQLMSLPDLADDVTIDRLAMNRDVDLTREIAAAVEAGCTRVIAAGGDGTVNAVVNALMKQSVKLRPELAIIPLGTANDFAGMLNIPEAPEEAVTLALRSTTRPIDVVEISGDDCHRYYANVAAGGNSVRVSEQMTDEVKRTWGALAYLRGALDVLPDMQSYHITAECDDERFELDSWAVLVANGRTNAGRIEVAPEALVDDGYLDVIIIRDGHFGDMAEIVASNFTGSFLQCEQVLFRKTRCLRLYSAPAMRFTLDGEVIDEVPIEFRVVAGALRVASR